MVSRLNKTDLIEMVDKLISYGFTLNFRPTWKEEEKILNYKLASKNLYVVTKYKPMFNEETGELLDPYGLISTLGILYKTKTETKLFWLNIERKNDYKNAENQLRRRQKKQKIISTQN